jgi:hypothetical protein
MFLRSYYLDNYQYSYIPSNLEYTRRIHADEGRDVEELLLFLWDQDPRTGYGPDGRIETIERRWSSVEERRMKWDLVICA